MYLVILNCYLPGIEPHFATTDGRNLAAEWDRKKSTRAHFQYRANLCTERTWVRRAV